MIALNEEIKKFIKNHAEEMCPRECCGFIVSDRKNFLKFIPAKNISDNNIEFCIDPNEFLEINNEYKIEYIYHSHADQKYENFSEEDIICAKNLNKNLILYITGTNIYKIYLYDTEE
ncbi:hypothetical protein EBU71_10090, partial [bacterium]|nr:hypothetical protein [Candidatus Elulimicrobium humile]